MVTPSSLNTLIPKHNLFTADHVAEVCPEGTGSSTNHDARIAKPTYQAVPTYCSLFTDQREVTQGPWSPLEHNLILFNQMQKQVAQAKLLGAQSNIRVGRGAPLTLPGSRHRLNVCGSTIYSCTQGVNVAWQPDSGAGPFCPLSLSHLKRCCLCHHLQGFENRRWFMFILAPVRQEEQPGAMWAGLNLSH